MLLSVTLMILLGSFANSALCFFRSPAEQRISDAVVPRRVNRDRAGGAGSDVRPVIWDRSPLDQEEMREKRQSATVACRSEGEIAETGQSETLSIIWDTGALFAKSEPALPGAA